MIDHSQPILEDDAKETVLPLFEHRLPWLVIGLIGGITAIIISSYFEEILAKHVSLAFFIPVIVYMADAVGTQTETIYVRNLMKKNAKFSVYFLKELSLGILLGSLFGLLTGFFALFWFKSQQIALSVGLAMAVSTAIAPIVALIVPFLLQKEHKDPALGAGPFTTIVQDLLSLIIYFVIAAFFIFR